MFNWYYRVSWSLSVLKLGNTAENDLTLECGSNQVYIDIYQIVSYCFFFSSGIHYLIHTGSGNFLSKTTPIPWSHFLNPPYTVFQDDFGIAKKL